MVTHLCELSDHAIALVSNELLNRGVVQDDIWVLADLYSAVCLSENLKPAVAGELFGDNHALATSLVVDLHSGVG